MKKVSEMQRALKSLERGAGPPGNKNGRGAKQMQSFMPSYESKEVQTDDSLLPNLLNKKLKGTQSVEQLGMRGSASKSKETLSSIEISKSSSKQHISKRSKQKEDGEVALSSSSSSNTIPVVGIDSALKSKRESEQKPGDETLRKMNHEKKVKDFIKWLVNEEKKVLIRAEQAVEEKEVVHQN